MTVRNEQTAQETLYGQYAGFVPRFLAFAIDRVIITAVIAAVTVFIGFLIQALVRPGGLTSQIAIIVLAVFGISFDAVYCVTFWLLAGQTPGKAILGVRIVRTNGKRIHFWPAVVRWLGYIVSSVLFLGYFWILVDSRRQAWHDKLAGTLVIYSWPEQEGRQSRPVRERLSGFRRSQEPEQPLSSDT
jgi:uncharacterized RDD family membrane protein YckC